MSDESIVRCDLVNRNILSRVRKVVGDGANVTSDSSTLEGQQPSILYVFIL